VVRIRIDGCCDGSCCCTAGAARHLPATQPSLLTLPSRHDSSSQCSAAAEPWAGLNGPSSASSAAQRALHAAASEAEVETAAEGPTLPPLHACAAPTMPRSQPVMASRQSLRLCTPGPLAGPRLHLAVTATAPTAPPPSPPPRVPRPPPPPPHTHTHTLAHLAASGALPPTSRSSSRKSAPSWALAAAMPREAAAACVARATSPATDAEEAPRNSDCTWGRHLGQDGEGVEGLQTRAGRLASGSGGGGSGARSGRLPAQQQQQQQQQAGAHCSRLSASSLLPSWRW
jgi:hypothetical protein